MKDQLSGIDESWKPSACIGNDHRQRCDVSKHTIHLWMNHYSTCAHLKPPRIPWPSIDRFQYSSNTLVFAPTYRYHAIHHSARIVSSPRGSAIQFRSAKAAPFLLFLPLGSVLKSLDSPTECELSDTPRWANSAARCFLSDRFEPTCLEPHAPLLGVGLVEDGNRCSSRRSEDRCGIGEIGDTLYWVEAKALAALNRALLIRGKGEKYTVLRKNRLEIAMRQQKRRRKRRRHMRNVPSK